MTSPKRTIGAVFAVFLLAWLVYSAVSLPSVAPTTTTTTTVKLAHAIATTTTTTITTTTTTTTVARSTGAWRCPQYEHLFLEYGLEPVETFSYIAYRESRCRKKAINAKFDEEGNIVWALNRNGSYDSGLLQINSTWQTVTREICGGGIELLMQVDCNLRVAKYLLDNGGLSHWGIKD